MTTPPRECGGFSPNPSGLVKGQPEPSNTDTHVVRESTIFYTTTICSVQGWLSTFLDYCWGLVRFFSSSDCVVRVVHVLCAEFSQRVGFPPIHLSPKGGSSLRRLI